MKGFLVDRRSARGWLLFAATCLSACTKLGGNADFYLGGDDESTAQQVHEALSDTLADLSQAVIKIRAATGTDPFFLPAQCASGDDDCLHLQALAKAGKYEFLTMTLRSNL